MITGSILGLPAVGMLLMSMPCINLGNEPQSSKNKRTILGGVLILIVGKRLSRTPSPQCKYHDLVDRQMVQDPLSNLFLPLTSFNLASNATSC